MKLTRRALDVEGAVMGLTMVRPACPADLKEIEYLRRADGADLGFIPVARYAFISERIAIIIL